MRSICFNVSSIPSLEALTSTVETLGIGFKADKKIDWKSEAKYLSEL